VTFKSDKRPHCRFCGKPIAKHTTTVYFGRSGPDSPWSRYVPDHKPETKAEAQRLLNETVVSVKRYGGAEIDCVGIWDGESWRDEFFCNGDHARRFAYACAEMRLDDGRPRLAMPSYWSAVGEPK
jgi:hypothetical protein